MRGHWAIPVLVSILIIGTFGANQQAFATAYLCESFIDESQVVPPTNSSAVEYPTATASYGTVVAVGIFDASTSGNLLAYASLTANKTVASGDVFRFNAGEVDITLT